MAKATDIERLTNPCKRMERKTSSHSFVERDLSCIWHPFTQAQTAPSPIVIVKGKDSYLYSDSGEAYLDAISSWWTNLHGHANPYIANKIAIQAKDLEHVVFAGHTHPQAIFFAERLLELLPSDYSRVFYSDNGSTSVEMAIKMAFQVKGKGKKLLSFQHAYHGDTFGAMSAAGKSHFNQHFWPYLFQVHSILPPFVDREEESWAEFEKAILTENIAAFIFEPWIQGAGGMRVHSKKWLSKMIARCHQEGIITIADEVMTGFGRTGPLFVCNTLNPAPDLLCLSKGITGGFLPMGATVAKPFIFDAFLSNDPSKAFLQGHSYTANPLACAAANASLDLLITSQCSAARHRIESQHLHFQKKWMHHPKLMRCEVLGTILAIEYKAENATYHHPLKERLSDFFKMQGVLIRPLGNILYIMPPYCMSNEELQKIYALMEITLEQWS